MRFSFKYTYVYIFVYIQSESSEIIRRWGKVKAGGKKQVIVLYMHFPLLLKNIIGTTTDQCAIVLSRKVETSEPH